MPQTTARAYALLGPPAESQPLKRVRMFAEFSVCRIDPTRAWVGLPSLPEPDIRKAGRWSLRPS